MTTGFDVVRAAVTLACIEGLADKPDMWAKCLVFACMSMLIHQAASAIFGVVREGGKA
jgi:hypothetical protein